MSETQIIDPPASDYPSEADGSPEAASSSGGSILASLRRIRDEKATEAAKTLVLDVPGYGEPSALAVVYRYPAGGYKAALKGAEIEQRGKTPDAQLEGNATLLIACCASVVGQRPDRTLVDLLTDETITPEQVLEMDSPLRFNPTLAEKLQIEIPDEVEHKNRFVVRHVFSPMAAATGRYEGDLSVIGQGNVVFAWLQGAVKNADEAISGE